MNRNWGASVFRQISLLRNLRQQWSRFKSRAIHYSYTFYRNDRRFFPKFKIAAAASTVGFTFREHGISDKRIAECEHCEEEFAHCKTPADGWELLYEAKDMLAFRRRIEGPYEMYEYKCVGTYYDISPRTFLDAQNDLMYRKEWDENIKTIEVVHEQDENELIRWVSKFPYPMYPREYVYVRRTWVSDDEKFAVVDSEAVQPEVFPSISNDNVRVTSYTSRMSIRAHSDWESHGVDYILTYADNPEANIPRYVYNWIVNKGGPYFLDQVNWSIFGDFSQFL
uniref:Phosphatidylcholine transfer protein n=1 Tax=Caenorhabditis japonica TaxID=281687 RepID=A0A8R1E3I1_CAEJA